MNFIAEVLAAYKIFIITANSVDFILKCLRMKQPDKHIGKNFSVAPAGFIADFTVIFLAGRPCVDNFVCIAATGICCIAEIFTAAFFRFQHIILCIAASIR